MLGYVFFHCVCPSEHLPVRQIQADLGLLKDKPDFVHLLTQTCWNTKNTNDPTLEGLGNKCEMIVFKAVPLATKLYAGVSGIYQLKIKTCSVFWQWTGREMKVSCKWLMVLPAALSLSNWPEVIWVVSIELSICNEIIDPGSAKCRDPSLMQREWWGYCCTRVPAVCASIQGGFSKRHRCSYRWHLEYIL